MEPPESRNGISVDFDDERDLPELREDSEPLDLLKWELTALKLDSDMDAKQHAKQTPWESVKNVRDAVAAEIEGATSCFDATFAFSITSSSSSLSFFEFIWLC